MRIFLAVDAQHVSGRMPDTATKMVALPFLSVCQRLLLLGRFAGVPFREHPETRCDERGTLVGVCETEGNGERDHLGRRLRHPAGAIQRDRGMRIFLAVDAQHVSGRMPDTATKMVALPFLSVCQRLLLLGRFAGVPISIPRIAEPDRSSMTHAQDCAPARNHLQQSPMTTATPPRRNWHLQRWLLLLAASLLAYAGWTTYAFRSALKEAKAMGWNVGYVHPLEAIQIDWKRAFMKTTWLDGVFILGIPTSEEFEQHVAIVHRLDPKHLSIGNAATLRDLSALTPLTRLQEFHLQGCTALTNVDALKKLSALKDVTLRGCTGLTNVDALKHLSALQDVELTDCTGLTNLEALKNLSALRSVHLYGCTGLTNLDALKNLTALQWVRLEGCTGLTNVDALKNLPALQQVVLPDCSGLTEESIDALKKVLPNATISIDIPGL